MGRIQVQFIEKERPAHFCTGAGQLATMVGVECLRLADIDWDDLSLSDLTGLEEAPFYLTGEAIRYIAPSILDLVKKHGEDALDVEFVDSFLFLPYAKDPERFLAAFSANEHRSYKNAFLELFSSENLMDSLSWAEDAGFLESRYPA